MIVAAETGLRPEEWIALERRDLDRAGRALAVQRKYAKGIMRPYGKSHRARRRVPLTARAFEAIEQLPPRLDTGLLFPAPMGGHLEISKLALTELVPGARGSRDREAWPVPPAPHVRDRGARRRCLDLRAVARDGDLDRDDRPPLRAPGPRLRGLDQGAAGRQIESFWRSCGVRLRAVERVVVAAIPHEQGDHG